MNFSRYILIAKIGRLIPEYSPEILAYHNTGTLKKLYKEAKKFAHKQKNAV